MNPLDQYVARIRGGIDDVTALIKGRLPDATPDMFGTALCSFGSATWAPVRAPSLDYSAFGDWEAWEECAIDTSGRTDRAAPTGSWVVWHAPSGQMIGFPGENSMRKAEMMAVLQNEGRPTRVVFADGGFAESGMSHAELSARVKQEVERLTPHD